MFQKQFVVHFGEGPRDPTKDTRLYSIRGTDVMNTRCFEVRIT